jgi:hypothetical protein
MKGITLGMSLLDKNEKVMSIISYCKYLIKNSSHPEKTDVKDKSMTHYTGCLDYNSSKIGLS